MNIENLTDEHALEAANKLGGVSHLSDESKIHQAKQLLTTNQLYVGQTNINGINWYRAFKYLEQKGYEIDNFHPNKFDITIHFTIKGQQVSQISDALNAWLKENSKIVDFSERKEGEPTTVLHHCFLPEAIVKQKGFPMDVVDFLDGIATDQVHWYSTSDDLAESRLRMLQNLKRLNGIALFVGEIKEGVADEFFMIEQMNIAYEKIPLL